MKGKSSYPLLKLGAAMRTIFVVALALALVDCHKSSSSSTTTGTYTIGGTVSGLPTGTSLTIGAGASAAFASAAFEPGAAEARMAAAGGRVSEALKS